jgi:cytochrome c biogenesis protein CcmG/thiol:disulfide interchange protein DsbE
MRVLRVLAAGVVAALLALLVWDVAHSSGGKVARDVDKGRIVPAPQFTLPRVAGSGHVSLASLRGKAVVVNFWQSDCVPCKQEQGQLNRTAAKWAGKGVVFLGIDEIEVRSFAQRYVERYHVSYDSLVDGDGGVGARFGITGTPETFFIDRHGRVVKHIISVVKPDALEAGIQRALSA